MFSSMLSLLGSLRGGSSFITNSLRFRSSASANLSRTPSVASNRQTWTWSGWVKRGTLGTQQQIFSANPDTNNHCFLEFSGTSDNLRFASNQSAVTEINLTSTAVYRDPSAWYHIVCVADTSNATQSLRARLFVNGVEITSFSTATRPAGTGHLTSVNATVAHYHSRYPNSASLYLDGYLTEVNFIDGQALTPASFGAIDSSTGVWAPRPYGGTYGTNGFYLKFADASAATAAAIGKDSSGNGNNWTPSGISVTAGATYDSMIDVPVNYSDGGNGRGNYCTLNPLATGTIGTSGSPEANLTIFGNNTLRGVGTMELPTSGKWYFEVSDIGFGTSGSAYVGIGSTVSQLSSTYCIYQTDGQKSISGSLSSYGAGWGAPAVNLDVVGVAVDQDLATITFYKNNVSQGSINHGIGATLYPIIGKIGLNQGIMRINFGQRPFAYTPPAGFRALNTNNLPTPLIVNGANFMAATTYTGNAAARSLSNAVNSVSFQPDLVWIKSRTPGATNHALFDSVRGTTKYLSSDTTAAETTNANTLTAFNGDGFSLGTDTTIVNANANSYIAWQWRESITAGLDVVSYAGTGVDRTVAHNLGVAPAMIIVKRSQTGATSNWQVRHTSIAAANSIQLNSTNPAAAATTVWASTAPTSSVFTVGASADVNASGISYVAYCFAQIAGFSRFGSYTGNGSVTGDGPFVFCGFRPRFVMIKSSTGNESWYIYDTSRNTSNVADSRLYPNLPGTEQTGGSFGPDMLSNGFKPRTNDPSINLNGATYIFAAFAEVPSKYALAR